MSDLIRYLEFAASVRPSPPAGCAYSCIEDFVLKHGRHYKVIPRPRNVRQMTMRMCFANALALAKRRKGLFYVEGYATSIIPVLHAWCSNTAGEVIDPTWPDGIEYYGVAFNLDYVISQFKATKYYSVLDNWTARWPLFTTDLDPKVWQYAAKPQVERSRPGPLS